MSAEPETTDALVKRLTIKLGRTERNQPFHMDRWEATKLLAALSEAQAERDEAINWSAIVEQHGTDKFDDLAEQWFAQEAVARMYRALSSVFIKYASTELMDRFNGQMRVITLQAFVEGALCGVRASKTEAQAELEAARGKCERMEGAAVEAVASFDNVGPRTPRQLKAMAALRAALSALEPGEQGGGT